MKCNVTDLSNELSNYVTELDSVEEYVIRKLESMDSDINKSNDILKRASNLVEHLKLSWT